MFKSSISRNRTRFEVEMFYVPSLGSDFPFLVCLIQRSITCQAVQIWQQKEQADHAGVLLEWTAQNLAETLHREILSGGTGGSGRGVGVV